MFQCNKCFIIGAIFLLVIGGGFSLMGDCATDPVKNEDTGECFTTIQAAIDDGDTDAGDRITVKSGTYTEQLTIDKSITLEGSSQWSTRIQYDSSPGIILVTADDVTIKNLGVFWTGSFGATYYGIKIESDDCLVDSVIVGDCPRNVYIYEGTGNTISNSIISTVFQEHESITIIGSQNVVCGNMLISSGDIIGIGILLFGSNTTQNEIIGNNIQNYEYGIYVFSANNNDIYYNNFLNNDTHAYTFITSPNYNQWDDGGTYGGNYWGTCTDSNCDGFCDTAYTIATGEVDNYPLAKMSTRKCQ